MQAVQATPLPNDYHTSSLTCANLALPKSVTVKIDVNDKATSEAATTMMESYRGNDQRLSHLQGHFPKFLAWFIFSRLLFLRLLINQRKS